MKIKKQSKISTIIFVVSILLGILLIVGPLILGFVNQSRSNAVVNSYNEMMGKGKYSDDLALAEEYNKAISHAGNDEILKRYDEILNIDNGMIGYIEIPRIGIKNPIYHGVEEEVLQKGIGHISTSSLPIGGAGTHAALSGHRGLPSSKLFTDLDQIKEGDVVLVSVANQTLAYKVYNIEVVKPDYADGLAIEDGRDLLTLITCTPYAINTHRLLVHAERTELTDDMKTITAERTISESDKILIIALVVVFVILLLDTFVILARKKKQK